MAHPLCPMDVTEFISWYDSTERLFHTDPRKKNGRNPRVPA
jgi:hypothetical protein